MIIPGQEAPSYTSEDEKGLVGSMLFDPTCVAEVLKSVRPTDFGDFALRAVFGSIVKRHAEAAGDGQALAGMVLGDLRDHPAVDEPRSLLLDVHEAVVTAAHAPTFAKAVRDAALKRRVYDAAEAAIAAASNGQSGDEVLADLREFAESETASLERRDSVPRYTLADLCREHPRLNDPVIDGLVREGETANLIASSKTGKSWMVYGLVLSIIANLRWLGRFDVSPGRVLLIDNELHAQTLANRIPAVADAMGIDMCDVDRDLDIWPLRGNLRSLAELRPEFDRIEPGEYKAVILDAKYRLAEPGVSENDNAAETQVYNLLDQYAAKTRAAFVLVHHASKGSQTDKAVTDVGAGAGAQSRATDCHMVLRPHEEDDCAVLDAAVRSFAPVEPTVLRWAFPVWIPASGLDPAKLKGRDGKAADRRKEKDDADKARIVEKLDGADEPLSQKALRTHLGIGSSRIERLLGQLTSDGVVATDEVRIRGNDTYVYSLSEGYVAHVAQEASGHAATSKTGTWPGPLKGAGPRTSGLRGPGTWPVMDRATSFDFDPGPPPEGDIPLGNITEACSP